MKITCIAFIVFTSILYACNANTAKDTASTVTDTVGVVPDSATPAEEPFTFSPADTVLLGFYQGMLPCKDCQGVKHTLLLKDSGRFKLEEFTMGKSTFPTKTEGRWIRTGDSIRLSSNQKNIAVYFIKGDTLRVTWRDADPITDSIAKNYWIVRQPNAASNNAWQQKGKQGVDFYAIGTEPFWSLEIDHEGSVSFRIADLPKPITVAFAQPRVSKDSTFFSLNSGSDKLEITLFNEFCSDGMSDNMYENRVHVRYKGETFKGCGLYLKK